MDKDQLLSLRDALNIIEQHMKELYELVPYTILNDKDKEEVMNTAYRIVNKIDAVRATPIKDIEKHVNLEELKCVEYKY